MRFSVSSFAMIAYILKRYTKIIQAVVHDGKLNFTFSIIFKSTCYFESFVKQN